MAGRPLRRARRNAALRMQSAPGLNRYEVSWFQGNDYHKISVLAASAQQAIPKAEKAIARKMRVPRVGLHLEERFGKHSMMCSMSGVPMSHAASVDLASPE